MTTRRFVHDLPLSAGKSLLRARSHCLLGTLGFALVAVLTLPASAFTRLERLEGISIIQSAEPYPGGNHNTTNLLDGNVASEFSSNAKGTNTFVEFDLGRVVSVGAFRHIDRNDPATVAESLLTFLGEDGGVVATLPIKHVNRRAGVTFVPFPNAIQARRIRWQVTALGSVYSTVGGAEIAFFKKGKDDSLPEGIQAIVRPLNLLERKTPGTGTAHPQRSTSEKGLSQPVKVTVASPYLEPLTATLKLGATTQNVSLGFGEQTFLLVIPATETPRDLDLSVFWEDRPLLATKVQQAPVRKMDIYILPHSHVDIGYTALQADVEKKQNDNLEIGLRLAKATATYPEGSRFKWNVEVLWPVENYLRSASPEKREALLAAIKSGRVGLDAFYGNILTGLCRPEELLRLMSYATRLSQTCGVPVESAMISDVPGYTWSTVSAMAHAGVKYFSFAPNYFDRMGSTMKEWQNKPFWWVGPDGMERVLCWCPSRGYALGHIIGDGEALARFLPDYMVELQTNNYPYAISHLRWNVHGDNGSPDEKIAEVIRDWNERYASPRLIISTTAEAFRAFERRYGAVLPEYAGDYTPFWEDGAGSSALETAMNRASAERLVQAETLFALRHPARFPAQEFQDAWRNVLLYSEHTWGAHNSISQPDLPFVKDQWKVKQAFAVDAERTSCSLLRRALDLPGSEPSTLTPQRSTLDLEVLNTSSWERTDLAIVPAQLSVKGDRVVDERNRPVASQRLSSGELVFLAKRIPAFGSRRFTLLEGAPVNTGRAKAAGCELSSEDLLIKLSKETGAIQSLFSRRLNQELCDPGAPTALNDFFYIPGSDVKAAKRNGTPVIRVKENGPLVASLVAESEAPGCRKLTREVRIIDGLDYVEIINLIDKLPVRTKEGLHFGYAFNVPAGQVRMDVGWAVVRPELDQIPASCKNWFSVQRWVDVSNSKFGVTWSSVDAPLLQVGGITANMIGSQTDWRPWVQHLEPSQTIYSWVMNNHWHTNYRAEQEGPTVFRFVIRPHRGFAPDEAARFGAACSQPLLVTRSAGRKNGAPLLRVSSDRILVTALKPSDDGRAWIARLFGAAGKDETVRLEWDKDRAGRVSLTDLNERPGTPVNGPVCVPAWGIVTVRAERVASRS